MKRLFFVRHAETNMNVAGIFSGKTETDLTAKGVSQATASGKSLNDMPFKVDLIICSPARRTLKTAKLVAEQINYPESKIEISQLLTERGFGDLEGTRGEDFWKNHNFKDIDKVPNVETVEELGIRAHAALSSIKERPEDNILIVSHGAIGRAIIREVKNIPHNNENKMIHRRAYHIDNAEIVELI
jgi:alpha-ribazole phosphatase